MYANSIGMNKEGAVCPNGFSSLWEVFDRQPESNRLLGVSFPDPTLRTQCIGKIFRVRYEKGGLFLFQKASLNCHSKKT